MRSPLARAPPHDLEASGEFIGVLPSILRRAAARGDGHDARGGTNPSRQDLLNVRAQADSNPSRPVPVANRAISSSR